MDQLPEVVVCVALIICGAWLVRGPKGRKQKPQNDAEEEDFTEYTCLLYTSESGYYYGKA